jgi:hypothetical protein
MAVVAILQPREEDKRNPALGLRLSNKGITHVYMKYNAFHLLRHLYLDSNKLVSLPPSIASLRGLETLDLSRNMFTDLPIAVVSQLRMLLTLHLAHNKLSSAGKNGPLPLALMDLHLEHNNIRTIGPHILRLTNLNLLNLSHNGRLKALPPEIGFMENIKWLDVSGTRVTCVWLFTRTVPTACFAPYNAEFNVPIPWTYRRHRHFPAEFRQRVLAFVLCNERDTTDMPYLPLEMIWAMLEFSLFGMDMVEI